MDTEEMRPALSYLKKKKPELTMQQYRTIRGQILEAVTRYLKVLGSFSSRQ